MTEENKMKFLKFMTTDDYNKRIMMAIPRDKIREIKELSKDSPNYGNYHAIIETEDYTYFSVTGFEVLFDKINEG